LQRKTLLLTVSVVVSVAVVSLSLFVFSIYPFYIYRPHFSLENKVESFVVHYEKGTNVTVNLQSTEGKELLSGCEAYMSNIFGTLLWMENYEGLTRIRNSTEHVEIILKEVSNFKFYVRASAVETTLSANRIFLFSSGSVLFTEIENEEILWFGGYGVDNGVAEFRNVVATFS